MLKSILREPLLHFLVIGAAVFAVFYAFNDPEPPQSDTVIEITPERITGLTAQFQQVWQRPPSEDELARIIDGYLREEIFYREALKLGLDQDDTVIRNRLQQKMEFLTDAGAEGRMPEAGELEAFYAENADRFTRAPLIQFEQLLLGDRDPAAALAALEQGAQPAEIGTQTLLPPAFEGAPPQVVDGTFGQGFFEAIVALEKGAWQGPVQSGFGPHLVRVTGFVPGTQPPLDDVRAAVLREWRQAEAARLRTVLYEGLKAQYEVIYPDEPGE